MIDHLSRSFAAQSASLDRRISEQFCWPSPDAGFALYAFHKLALKFPTEQRRDINIPKVQALSQAPELATSAYFMACYKERAFEIDQKGWVDAFSRLMARDPFPFDRHSFAYRPVELLGITLGAYQTVNLPGESKSWLSEVLIKASDKAVTSTWAKYLVSLARTVAGLRDGLNGVDQLQALADDELALLIWLISSEQLCDAGRWREFCKPEVYRRFLERCLAVEPSPADVGRTALTQAAMQISTNSLLQSEIARNWQLRSSTKDAVELVQQLCQRFYRCATQLQNRYCQRAALKIKDEYDVQDLMHALLQLHFEDVRPEEWTPSYAGTPARMDFLLKRECVVVETKMTRKNLQQKEIASQLIEDKGRYRTHPNCDALVCFVYDPSGYCKNPVALEDDVSEDNPDFLVRVIVGPQGN